ncbi:MAG: hypothetical protein ACYC6N_01375 [Pirellulaceae bacterium]
MTYEKNGAPVTAADMKPLLRYVNRLKHFHRLAVVSDSAVQESALRSIAAIQGIDHLELSTPTGISADELRPLSGMRNLKALVFNHCLEIRDSGRLCDLTSLESLAIYVTNIDDPHFAFLSEMKKLRILRLAHVPCDDRAIDVICRLQKLERVQMTGTDVSQQGIDRLRAALPNCNTWNCMAKPGRLASSSGLNSGTADAEKGRKVLSDLK